MIEFFTPPATDQSVGYLATIFGDVGGVIPSNVASGGMNILSVMFLTFNSVALTIGALIVVYMTVMGVIMTAHEGEFMKKWHSLWTPLRAVMGIAALIPTASGYCGLQILMMWVVVQGIGAADSVWSTALSYASAMGSPVVQAKIDNPGVLSSMQGLFAAITCDESARATYPAISPTTVYFCGKDGTPTSPFCGSDTIFRPTETSYSFGPPQAACGKLTYCDKSKACD